MSDEVEVPFGDKPGETATLLLAAAEELDLPPAVVGTREGSFVVPQEVHDKAFSSTEPEPEPEPQPEPEPEPEPEKKPAKKTAKKTARKK